MGTEGKLWKIWLGGALQENSQQLSGGRDEYINTLFKQ